MKLYEYKAYEQSEMLKKGEISARELTESYFERIDEVESKVDAYITLNRENALLSADDVDKKRASGEALDKLAGIPIGIKDNISTDGIKTTCASKMLENYEPVFNATVVNKLKSKGAVITGKLNMDEFAMGSSTENSYFKRQRTPSTWIAYPAVHPAGRQLL